MSLPPAWPATLPLTSEPAPLPPFWDSGPPALDPVAARPTVDDVAALERTRTFRDDGSEGATFDDQTRPSDVEVELLIDEALDAVLGQLPDHVDVLFYPAISRLIAVRAAMSVETSYFREQQVESPASTWAARFGADLAALQAAIPDATWIA
jgi:hypothetical protein